jgi:hypothetical protein
MTPYERRQLEIHIQSLKLGDTIEMQIPGQRATVVCRVVQIKDPSIFLKAVDESGWEFEIVRIGQSPEVN